MQTEREDSLVKGLLSGIAVFRWLAWGWLAVILVLSRQELTEPEARPWVAYVLAALALLITAGATVLARRKPEALLSLPVVATETTVAFALMVGDQLAYNGVTHSQWLGSAWPLAGIFTAGIAFGARGGLVAGTAVGLGRLGANLVDTTFAWDEQRGLVSTISTVVLYALAGGTAGFVTLKLRGCRTSYRVGSGSGRGGPHTPRRSAADLGSRPAPVRRSGHNPAGLRAGT